MPSVSLVPVTVDNWQRCIALTVAPEQQDFVASNLYSTAEAQFHPNVIIRAVTTSGEEITGLVVSTYSATNHQYKVVRLMIDQYYQGQGYGRAAITAVVTDVLATSDATELWISYRVWNERARRLYQSIGFHEHHQEENGRITASLNLLPSRHHQQHHNG